MSLYDLAGWTEIGCREADEARGAQPVQINAGLHDIDGEHGEAVIYTEWCNEHEAPVLRDYLWHPNDDDAWSTHFIPDGAP